MERQRRQERFAEIARVRSEKKVERKQAIPVPDGVNALLAAAAKESG